MPGSLDLTQEHTDQASQGYFLKMTAFKRERQGCGGHSACEQSEVEA